LAKKVLAVSRNPEGPRMPFSLPKEGKNIFGKAQGEPWFTKAEKAKS
jgi:hypothetical protein